jgi:predicted ester cyclase
MTARDEAAALVSRLLDCFNTRKFDQAVDLYAPDFISRPFGTGAEAGMQAWRVLVAKYPEMRLGVEQILVDGDRVVVRSTVEGTGTVSFGAQPMLIEIFRIENGRLAEWWGSTWLPDLSS